MSYCKYRTKDVCVVNGQPCKQELDNTDLFESVNKTAHLVVDVPAFELTDDDALKFKD